MAEECGLMMKGDKQNKYHVILFGLNKVLVMGVFNVFG